MCFSHSRICDLNLDSQHFIKNKFQKLKKSSQITLFLKMLMFFTIKQIIKNITWYQYKFPLNTFISITC